MGIAHTSVMRLHALQGKAEEAPALAVNGSLLGDDGALNRTSRPEGVAHGAPGVLGVGAVVACAILSSHEARRRPRDLEVDQAALVAGSLDGVVCAIFGELQGNAVGEERILLLVEAEVRQGVGGPEGGLLVLRVEYLAVELARNVDAPRLYERPDH